MRERLAALLALSLAAYCGAIPVQEGLAAAKCSQATSLAFALVEPYQERLAGYLKSRQSAIHFDEYNLVTGEILGDERLYLNVYLNAYGETRWMKLSNEQHSRMIRHAQYYEPPPEVGPEFIRAYRTLRPSVEAGFGFCSVAVPLASEGRLLGILGFIGENGSKDGKVPKF